MKKSINRESGTVKNSGQIKPGSDAGTAERANPVPRTTQQEEPMAMPAMHHEAARRSAQLRRLTSSILTANELEEMQRLGSMLIGEMTPGQLERSAELRARRVAVSREEALAICAAGGGRHFIAPGPRFTSGGRSYFEAFFLDDPRVVAPGAVIYDARHFRLMLHQRASEALGVRPTKRCECHP